MKLVHFYDDEDAIGHDIGASTDCICGPGIMIVENDEGPTTTVTHFGLTKRNLEDERLFTESY